MKRNVVQVAKIRIKDAQVGDVVHRDGKERKGWFQVAMREVLFNGELQLSDVSTHITLSGGHLDIIGIQFVQEVDVPDQQPPEPVGVPNGEQPHSQHENMQAPEDPGSGGPATEQPRPDGQPDQQGPPLQMQARPA